MHIEEYIHIAKEEFSYLFDEYGFKVVYRDEGQGRDRGRNAFGLESDIYRLRVFFSTHGGGNVIFLGPLSALFFDEHFEWVALVNLLVYLDHQRIDWSELERARESDRSEKSQMRVYFGLQSKWLRPHCPKALEMFSSPEAILAWKPFYEELLEREYRKKPGRHHK